MHTSPTCNFQGSANRLRDIADWQTRQGGGRVYLKQSRQSALGCVCVAGKRQINTLQQVTHLLTGGAAGLYVRAFLLMQ